MNEVHRSIGFSAISRYGSTFFQIMSMAILARLLTPSEFGIYTAISALTILINVSSREFGGANYLIQKSHLTEGNIRTAFTISLAMSVGFAVVLFEIRDAAAAFYSQPGLNAGIAVAAVNFLLTPFSGTIMALLRRELQFDAIAACNLVASLVAAVVSVTLAACALSFMSPILGSLVGQAVLVMLLVNSQGRLRLFRPSLRGWREVIAFGFYSSAVAIVNVLYQMSPQLIIGRVLDFAAVGVYGRALNVTQIFDKLVLEVLNPVIMPAVAAQTRAGADLKPIYLHAVELLTAVQWPFLVFTALMADPIVRILLGAGWEETVPLIQMLCFASLTLFAACLTYPVLVAIGRVGDTLTATLISVPPSLAIVFGASFFGVRAVAASALATLPLQAGVAFYFIMRRLAIHPDDLARSMAKSLVVTALSAAGGVAPVGLAALGSLSMLEFSEAGIGALVGWWIGLVVTGHPLLAQLRVVSRSLLSAVPRLQARRNVQAGSNIQRPRSIQGRLF
jgi:O-antigen/teichoic acid export membrane protein